jgi:hypothetical protein
MKRSLILFGLLVLVLIAAITVYAEMVPFKGRLVGEATLGDLPCYVPRTMVISGQVTHLGNSTLIGDHCFVLQDILDWEEPGDKVRFDRGQGTWTAANGDEIYSTYEGEYFPVSDPKYNPPEGPLSVEMEITGGTGKFDGAEGVAYGAGYSTPGEQGLSVSFYGTISSVDRD